MCLCACLTCDPGATLAAYGSNWAARKLTKCQWSVVPQEVINCRPRGQWGSCVSIYFLPQTVLSAWIMQSTIYYVSFKWCQLFFKMHTARGPLLGGLFFLGFIYFIFFLNYQVAVSSLVWTVHLLPHRGKLQQPYCYWFSPRKILIQCFISALLARSSVSLQTIPSLFGCLFMFSPAQRLLCYLVIFHCWWAKLGGMVWELGCVKGATVVCVGRSPPSGQRYAECAPSFQELQMFSCKSLFREVLLVHPHKQTLHYKAMELLHPEQYPFIHFSVVHFTLLPRLPEDLHCSRLCGV